jgi:hypothetical protein
VLWIVVPPGPLARGVYIERMPRLSGSRARNPRDDPVEEHSRIGAGDRGVDRTDYAARAFESEDIDWSRAFEEGVGRRQPSPRQRRLVKLL